MARDGRIYEFTSLDDNNIKISLFNPVDFTTTLWFQTSKEELRTRGVDADSIITSAAVISPNGEEVAIPLTVRNGPSTFVVLSRSGEVFTVVPEFGFRTVELGAVVWSLDGSKLYATAMVTVHGSDTRMFSIAEIPRGKGKAILTPLVTYGNSFSTGEDILSAPLSLSPDGSTLAATTAAFPNKSVSLEDRGLFLFNLADPESLPKKVTVPGLENFTVKGDSKE
jgi:hypothetical protein